MFIPPSIARGRRRAPHGWIGRGGTAFAAALIVATAAAAAPVAGNDAAMVLQASLQPADPGPASAPGDGELRSRIEGPAGLVVGGEALHRPLLRQFYAGHNFAPVWTTRQAQAEALRNVVLRAGEHGLDPDLFHGAVLRNTAGLSPIDRELLLSDAVLAYADALARGALPIERRMDDEDLQPEPVSVVAALDRAIDSPDPAAVIERLAPQSPGYKALQRALRSYQTATANGAAAPPSAAGDNPRRTPQSVAGETGATRLQQIVVNLERWRWLPRNLPAERVWVNAASAELVLYREDRPVFTSRVVVGRADQQTPEFQTTIDSLLFNPPWNVPYSIATKEILPKLDQDPDYLNRHRMVIRSNGAIQQLPGAGTALGVLKFEMQDRFTVYLHDTPLKQLFGRDNRRQSHGCVRVQKPRELAALLLGQPVEEINRGIALGYTNRRMLPKPVPVFIVYQDAFAAPDGTIEFRPDVYGRDDEVWQRLQPRHQAPVAQGEAATQRRG
ncbi:MAG TPA: L,D-transpeptidase family protein [Stellaceae bacterium]|nr:L,D-transpeptidase family protein [Stellaceae bacterium]